jgi:phosphoribosyl-dephospho-CoA transferase
MATMVPLRRHQLVRLTDAGWHRVLDRPSDDEARDCLSHWAAQRLPLVVTRQPSAARATEMAMHMGTACAAAAAMALAKGADAVPAPAIAVGLAAPQRWQRRRLALSVSRQDVAWFDEFPRADQLALPSRSRDWRSLALALHALGAAARVYGSHGWQLLSGLPCVHARSDVDLWIGVHDAAQADAVAALLGTFDAGGSTPRLDGELLFPGGHAVAWREWRTWRSGGCRAILAKTLTGQLLVSAPPHADRQHPEALPW